MRKVLISLAAAGTAVALASPASAQAWGNMGPYGAPYGYNSGYGYGYGNAGRWQQQLQQIRYEMRNLAVQGRLTRSEGRDLNRDIRSAERSLRNASYRGISPWEARSMDQRIANLRYELRRYADYDGRRGWNRGYGYNGDNGYYRDRNRDRDRDWDGDRDRDRD
jgi:hypothetical protein